MAVKLKQERVDTLVAECRPGMKPKDVIDAGGPGLILRLKPRGAHWGLKFERGDKTLRMKIGTPDLLTLEQARYIAGKARSYLDAGNLVAPSEDWLRDRYVELELAKPARKRDPVLVAKFEEDVKHLMKWRFDEARDEFLAEVKRTLRHDTWVDYRAMLYHPELEPVMLMQVRHITQQHLAILVAEIHRTGTERKAEKLASVLRPMWTFLCESHRQHLTGVTTPMPMLKAPKRSAGVKPRSNGKVPGAHVATPSEIGFVIAVARSGVIERSLSVAMELMVATGQRRRPVASALRVDFVDWVEMPGWGIWSMGPAHRKTAAKRQDKHRHVIPLPPALWERLKAQMARTADKASEYVFPQLRARKKGGRVDGHLSAAALNHRLLDMGVWASPHDLRRGLSSACQNRLGVERPDVKLVLDHNEGIPTNDVLEAHYTVHDRLDKKGPVMEVWWPWFEAQAAAATLPPLAELRKEIARRRREREAEGKAKTAARKAAREAAEKAKAEAAALAAAGGHAVAA
ncbi:integrase family protein [Methylobacterium platani]|uniref:Tyr recombinase domain-containing protein n=2 Tax=Methylobacterium platani TaxID=427683 RepID=A0A179SDH9_9HYPH|nr:integrase family protein [Methylobacterium platani]KMO21213.1 hypothetical protein SQ03_03890 [Methylobacterium platani JCM 14648]OAS24914.1 hypothetical protein A5481_12550 [Methylobacterium platani]